MDSDDRTRRFRQWKSLCMKDLGIKSMASTRGARASSKTAFSRPGKHHSRKISSSFFCHSRPNEGRVSASSPIRTGRKEFPISPGRRVHPGRAPPGDPENEASPKSLSTMKPRFKSWAMILGTLISRSRIWVPIRTKGSQGSKSGGIHHDPSLALLPQPEIPSEARVRRGQFQFFGRKGSVMPEPLFHFILSLIDFHSHQIGSCGNLLVGQSKKQEPDLLDLRSKTEIRPRRLPKA